MAQFIEFDTTDGKALINPDYVVCVTEHMGENNIPEGTMIYLEGKNAYEVSDSIRIIKTKLEGYNQTRFGGAV